MAYVVGGLESLRNPLNSVDVLRGGVNLWKNPLDGTSTWLAEVQYFVNSLVTDPTTGGAFVMCGGPDGLTAIRGGDAPNDSATGVWESLATYGVSDFTSITSADDPALTVAGAGNVYTVTNGTLLDLAPGSSWLVTWQGTAAGGSGAGGAMTAADIATWTVTPTGVGAVTAAFTVCPVVGATSLTFAGSVVVKCGAAAVGPPVVNPQLSVSGAYAGTVQTVTASVSYVRLA